MKTSKLLFILTSIMIVVFTNCGNNPFEPYHSGEIELWTLAPGARWEYNTYYSSHSYSSDGYDTRTDHTGRLSVNILEIDNIEKDFLVEVKFVIDSLYYYRRYFDYEVSDYKTITYTIYQGDPGIPSFSDSSMEFNLVLERDTLWCLEDGNLLFLMPRRFVHGGMINLRPFYYPGTGNLDEINWREGESTGYGFRYRGYNSNHVDFYRENGGLTFLDVYDGWAGISGDIKYLKYTLKNYEPGQVKDKITQELDLFLNN